ncbi:MAG TPA: M23 family peptidase [Bacteroidetes bacterium]|nr:M23 family peptidase [Bacteroidota bacterium]
MARIKYYYNTETCSFEKAKINGATLVRTSLSYLLVAGIICSSVAAYMFYFYGNPIRLMAKNQTLQEHLVNFDETIAKLETDIESLHQQDEDVYRAILKADPIKDEWQVGTGGAAEYKPLETKALQDTKERLERMESKVNVQMASYEDLLVKFKSREEELKHMPSMRPISTDLISGFGYRMHPILKVRKLHTGLDFRAPMGTLVYATADGLVTHAGGGANGYGNHINIDHGYGYETKYGHLSKSLVQEGQRVKRGDIIGHSGNSGLSKGPHLHYEIKKDGTKIDPVDYFYSDLTPEQYIGFKKQAQQYNESMD